MTLTVNGPKDCTCPQLLLLHSYISVGKCLETVDASCPTTIVRSGAVLQRFDSLAEAQTQHLFVLGKCQGAMPIAKILLH
jgi:hypothetical protein